MSTRSSSKVLVLVWMFAVALSPTAPTLAEIITFQQGTNGYERGQDTSIRWAYAVNFGDTADVDNPHPGDPGSYEMRSTNSGSSAVLEVGQFFQRVFGSDGERSSVESGPTYRYSRIFLRFRDVFGTGPNQVSPEDEISRVTLKLYNTQDLGAAGAAGGAYLGETTTVTGPGGIVTTEPNIVGQPKLNAGSIAIYPLLTPIRYGNSDGAASKGESNAEYKRRGKELWSARWDKGLWLNPNDPIIAQFFGPRELNDPYVGQQKDIPFNDTVTPGITGEYDANHPGVVEVFQDATEGFKVFDVTGLMDFITGEGVFLTVLLPDESELPTLEHNFGNAYRSHEFGGPNASAEQIATRPMLVIELGGSMIPGDANFDGLVDVADLGIVGANFNADDMQWNTGDFNLDGITDVADLGILGANWTASQATSNVSALVPEPTTLSLVVMSVLMVGRRRRQEALISQFESSVTSCFLT